MRPEQTVAFAIFSIAAAGTPGPSNTLLTATGANAGLLRGLPVLLGVVTGMGLLMFVVAYGLGAVILANSLVLAAVKWCGAAVLCWLAWKIATNRQTGMSGDSKPLGFLGAAAFQWVNPKSWLVCASAAATFLDQGAGSALIQAGTLGLIFVLAALPSCFPWLALGAILQHSLRGERAWRTFNAAMGALLAASVILIIW